MDDAALRPIPTWMACEISPSLGDDAFSGNVHEDVAARVRGTDLDQLDARIADSKAEFSVEYARRRRDRNPERYGH